MEYEKQRKWHADAIFSLDVHEAVERLERRGAQEPADKDAAWQAILAEVKAIRAEHA